MNVKVNFYGVLAEVTGCTELTLDKAETVQGLIDKLLAIYPGLKTYPYRVCVGQSFAEGNQILENGTVVSLLPPFSGG